MPAPCHLIMKREREGRENKDGNEKHVKPLNSSGQKMALE